MNRLLGVRNRRVILFLVGFACPQTIWAGDVSESTKANNIQSVSRPASVSYRWRYLRPFKWNSSIVSARNTPRGTSRPAVHLGGDVSLNPQPLPPKDPDILPNAARLGDKVSLNPQPLPPKDRTSASVLLLGDAVSLNPQPLPPKDPDKLPNAAQLGAKVSLNPQPLPPKAKSAGVADILKLKTISQPAASAIR